MRVIAGTLRSRRLEAPSWIGLRPTSDRLRETAFNVIGARVTDAAVLDLFTGTGAIAIEALSRGARRATCVDSDRRAIELARSNVARCGLRDRIEIVHTRVEVWAGSVGTWDIIYLDPPYDRLDFEPLLRHVAPLAAPHAWIMLEHAAKTTPPTATGPARRMRTIRSGDSALSIYACEMDSRDTGVEEREP